MSKFLTVDDCASAAHVQPRTIREAITSGGLPALRVARRYLIAESDFANWLQSHRVEVSA